MICIACHELWVLDKTKCSKIKIEQPISTMINIHSKGYKWYGYTDNPNDSGV